jgi:hypothetical protein
MVQNNVLVEFPLETKENNFNKKIIFTYHRFQVVDKIDIQDAIVVHEIS